MKIKTSSCNIEKGITLYRFSKDGIIKMNCVQDTREGITSLASLEELGYV